MSGDGSVITGHVSVTHCALAPRARKYSFSRPSRALLSERHIPPGLSLSLVTSELNPVGTRSKTSNVAIFSIRGLPCHGLSDLVGILMLFYVVLALSR